VFRLRPDQPVVCELLLHVRRPAGHARTGEEVREQVHGYAERVVDGSAEEVDVGVHLLALAIHLLAHRRLDDAGDLQPARIAAPLEQLLCELLQYRRTRVERSIDAMPEAHDLLTAT